MKKLFTVTLLFATLTTFGGYATAATTVKGGKSNGSEVATSTAAPMRMTAKVTAVSTSDKTFAVISKGKNFVFSAAKLNKLPAVGEIVDISYTENPGGGPLESINLNSSRSNVY